MLRRRWYLGGRNINGKDFIDIEIITIRNDFSEICKRPESIISKKAE
jgi:hypothetical protein